MTIRPNQALVDCLGPAYTPCSNFGACQEAVWDPARGHVPRGFLGATGALSEVEAILVFAEPGHAHEGESYDPNAAPEDILMQTVEHTYHSIRNGRDLFHRNIRWFLDRLYPGVSFEAQLRHVWLTEGRLCSISQEIGSRSDRLCASRYLAEQVALMPQATVIGFGGKAATSMRDLPCPWIKAYALAPPGANHRPARPSWEDAIAALEARRR